MRCLRPHLSVLCEPCFVLILVHLFTIFSYMRGPAYWGPEITRCALFRSCGRSPAFRFSGHLLKGSEAGLQPVGTCLLFAVSPACVFYATEGRMYSLLLLCSVGMLWLTLCLWDRGFSAARFALWVAVGVAGLLTHYFFVFVWCAAVFWLQIQPGQYPQRLSRVGVLLTLLLVLPWYVHLPEIMSQWHVTGYWLWRRPNGYHPITTALVLP